MMMQWYVVIVYAGREEIVKHEIEDNIEGVEEIIVPKNDENELLGYIFVKMNLTNEALYKINEIEGVNGFLGKDRKYYIPEPIEEKEIKRLKKSLFNSKKPKDIEVFNIGDTVIIKYGDLASIFGKIVEIKKRVAKIQSSNFKNLLSVTLDKIELYNE